MKRFITSPTGLSPAEKEKRRNSPTMLRRDSRSSLTSTTSSVRRELDRNLAFEKSPNGPMRDRVTVDILKINGEDFKGTISPLEAKNKSTLILLLKLKILSSKETLAMGKQFLRAKFVGWSYKTEKRQLFIIWRDKLSWKTASGLLEKKKSWHGCHILAKHSLLWKILQLQQLMQITTTFMAVK